VRRYALLLPLLGTLAACGGGGPGTVAGDVFVVLDTGAEVDVVGAPVRLVEDAARIDTALAALCAGRRDELARAGAEDVTEERRAARSARWWEARARLLASAARAAAATGPDARFRFDSVPPGRYRVWTDAEVQGERWSWTEPVRVGGDSVHVSLGNHNADGDPFRCQLLWRMEADSAPPAA
jgi:hypothetical protein